MLPVPRGWVFAPGARGRHGLLIHGENGEMVQALFGGWQECGPRFARPSDEQVLFQQDVVISCDGQRLVNGDKVYVLSIPQLEDCVLTIEYFHGWYQGLGGAAAVFEERHRHGDRPHISRNMILVARRIGQVFIQDNKGFVVRRIISLQRLFRRLLQGHREQRAYQDAAPCRTEPTASAGSNDIIEELVLEASIRT